MNAYTKHWLDNLALKSTIFKKNNNVRSGKNNIAINISYFHLRNGHEKKMKRV